MIKNLKLGLKSLRYAYGIKLNLLLLIAFLALGIVCHAFGNDMALGVYGDFMLMCTAMVPAQLIFSLSASNMVLASPVRKKMQTSIPALLTYSNMVLVYIAMFAYRMVRVWGNPGLAGALGGELVAMAVMMALFMLYLGVAYKYFIVSVLLVVVVMVLFSINEGLTGSLFYMELFGQGMGSVALSALLGMGILVLGGFLQYLVSLLLYRAPMSKMAQSAPLRREL